MLYIMLGFFFSYCYNMNFKILSKFTKEQVHIKQCKNGKSTLEAINYKRLLLKFKKKENSFRIFQFKNL